MTVKENIDISREMLQEGIDAIDNGDFDKAFELIRATSSIDAVKSLASEWKAVCHTDEDDDEEMDALRRFAVHALEKVADVKFYWVVDDQTRYKALMSVEVLDYSDEEDAIYEAEEEWESLSDLDRMKRDAFYLISAPCDVDMPSMPDWNHSREVWRGTLAREA